MGSQRSLTIGKEAVDSNWLDTAGISAQTFCNSVAFVPT
jgi:hypothetical protein